jgi:hypothetical protein
VCVSLFSTILFNAFFRSDKYKRVTLEMLSGTRADIRVHGRLLLHVTKVFVQLSVTDAHCVDRNANGQLLMHIFSGIDVRGHLLRLVWYVVI